MRLDHLQYEGHGDARIERVAAALQDAHADRGRDPVRRRNDAERSRDLRARREPGIKRSQYDRLGDLCADRGICWQRRDSRGAEIFLSCVRYAVG